MEIFSCTQDLCKRAPNHGMPYLFAKSVLNVGCSSESVLSEVSTWCYYVSKNILIQKYCD